MRLSRAVICAVGYVSGSLNLLILTLSRRAAVGHKRGGADIRKGKNRSIFHGSEAWHERKIKQDFR